MTPERATHRGSVIGRNGSGRFAALLAVAGASRLLAADSGPANDIPKLLPPHEDLPPTFLEECRHSWAVAIIAVALLLLAGAVIWFARRKKPAVVVPPELRARLALAELGHRVEDGAALSSVTLVLRHYVAAAFNLTPDELTTAEFCDTVAKSRQIGPELSTALADFLRQCDDRKFAPEAVAANLDAARRALQLVDVAEARRAAIRQFEAQSTKVSAAAP